ncbi:hypothetical protein HOT82_gp121 [Gordonia phage Ronaldo]|uniref:Uncharacterized protein n=3 Tax=Ronaldovirus ronaldo TaxID=2734270 RepID=A0A6B9L8C3_9CAUD|nr:hypothetical protein HOT82_gp121 [Gordonia phage Ronaldo]AXN53683.1 hypothetical protein SEA_RONALDO_121 [Gordonia phage Ronaldo]QDH48460.1 hypothetical protein SEA_ZIKO_122 [Gordonia phage Ziko]QHB38237.1 hypothetical protein SEA_VOLT_124 [Gordonia phage Volt]
MVTKEEIIAAHKRLEEAVDELVRLASQAGDGDRIPSTVAGYILAVDNRFIDEQGYCDGYISYYDPLAGQPEHISRMILHDALEVAEMRQAMRVSGDDDD